MSGGLPRRRATATCVDGADEVHLRTIAREAFEDVDESEREPVVRDGE